MDDERFSFGGKWVCDYFVLVNFISVGFKKGVVEEVELEDFDDEEKFVK